MNEEMVMSMTAGRRGSRALKRRIDLLESQLRKMEERLSALEKNASPARKKPGRKPKVVEALKEPEAIGTPDVVEQDQEAKEPEVLAYA